MSATMFRRWWNLLTLTLLLNSLCVWSTTGINNSGSQEVLPTPTVPEFPLPVPKVVVTEFRFEEGANDDVLTISVTSYVDKNGRPTTKPTASSSDSGMETLKNAGISLAVVVVVALIGIFILRKWKFSPTSRFRQKLASAEGIRQRTNESDTVFLRELHAP